MTAPDTVLIVDDEPKIRALLRDALVADGVAVIEASTGAEGIGAALESRPQLIVLDLGLPDMDGVGALSRGARVVDCADHRALGAALGGREDAAARRGRGRLRDQAVRRARAAGARCGRSCAARACARCPAATRRVRAADLEIDLARRTVRRAAQPVHLTPTEWELLHELVIARRGARSPTASSSARCGGSRIGDAQGYLRVYVAHLRRKLEADPYHPRLLLTDAGVGYRFESEGVTGDVARQHAPVGGSGSRRSSRSTLAMSRVSRPARQGARRARSTSCSCSAAARRAGARVGLTLAGARLPAFNCAVPSAVRHARGCAIRSTGWCSPRFSSTSVVATQLLDRAQERTLARAAARERDRAALACSAPRRSTPACRRGARRDRGGDSLRAGRGPVRDPLGRGARATDAARARGRERDTAFDDAASRAHRVGRGARAARGAARRSHRAGGRDGMGGAERSVAVAGRRARAARAAAGARAAVGVLRVVNGEHIAIGAEQREFLRALSYYAALGVERVRLVAAAERAEAFRQADGSRPR